MMNKNPGLGRTERLKRSPAACTYPRVYNATATHNETREYTKADYWLRPISSSVILPRGTYGTIELPGFDGLPKEVGGNANQK